MGPLPDGRLLSDARRNPRELEAVDLRVVEQYCCPQGRKVLVQQLWGAGVGAAGVQPSVSWDRCDA
jgi:hypothetical protein